jgi:putative FmdB family regulatory protein
MPIYVYSCSKCKKEFQVRQKMSDPKPNTCSECGSLGSLDKVIAPSGFRLDGGGWFNQGYMGGGRGGSSGMEH